MKWYNWLVLSVFVVFLPVAFLGAFILPNEYAAQGIVGAVDCDGPIQVMIFAIPSYLVYGSGVIGFGLLFFKTKNLRHLISTLICSLIVVSITPNVLAAIKEHEKNETENLLTCGKGW
jgi:hypothetical protein